MECRLPYFFKLKMSQRVFVRIFNSYMNILDSIPFNHQKTDDAFHCFLVITVIYIYFFGEKEGVDNLYLVSVLVCLPLCSEGVPLLMVQILFQVKERIEKDRCHLALLQVPQGDLVARQGTDHIQHLNKISKIHF